MRADAIDLSHYDDVQDGFAGTKALGVLGVINKLTEGMGYVDPSFNWRRGPCARQGLLYGAYHFLRPGNPRSQVKFFLDHAGNIDGLRLCLDHEDPDVSMGTAAAWIKAFYDQVGAWPTYYSFQSFILERRRQMDPAIFGKCPLWLAAYNSVPQWPRDIWPIYDLWQFTGDGNGNPPHHIPGIVIDGGCDINVAHDRLILTETWATVKDPQPRPEPPPPSPPPLPFDPTPILKIAAQSEIARYSWAGRGMAPIGYTKGMALTFARCLKNLQAGDQAALLMASPNSHNGDTDVLSWYAGVFNSRGMPNDAAGPDTLRHLFALMMGLGMRESSGLFTEGRDMSAENTTAATAEAGLFQQSYNSTSASPGLYSALVASYQTNLDGYANVFREGVSKPMTGNYGSGSGRLFQQLCKEKPAFAVEAAAIGLRTIRRHWGPLNRYETELRIAADTMLKAVQAQLGSG